MTIERIRMAVSFCILHFALFILHSLPAAAHAQQAPEIGYMFPPGGAAGSTVEVVLGGYDWTPDMQVFVVDSPAKLEIVAPPGPVIVPEPPYWFGKKARRPPFLLPRETRARLTLPADLPAGAIEWQAANANGATKRGRFLVSRGREVVEVENRETVQILSELPVTVSGRIQHIEEVDRYQITAAKSGPVTCRVFAQAIGSPLNAVLEVRDEEGRTIADAADTDGRDVVLTFAAMVAKRYTIGLYDADFRGNRAFVYRLEVTPGPAVLAAIPAAGKPGETKAVRFVGYGVATGAAALESVTANVTFPNVPAGQAFPYSLETAWGLAPARSLRIGDLPEKSESDVPSRMLTPPMVVTGAIEDRYGTETYRFSGKQGEVYSITAEARRIGSPLDLSVTVLDAAGKELTSVDDLPGTVDAGLEFTLPADGDYQLALSDVSGFSGNAAAVYRLEVRPAAPSFELSVPDFLVVPSEGKAQLTVTATRSAGFKEAIAIALSGLPPGVAAADNPTIPSGQASVKVDLTSAAGSAATAGLVAVSGAAAIGGTPVTRAAGHTLVAVTLKPPFSVDAEGKDDVTKWPRGSTFPGPVLIEREKGFDGEIRLEMAARQGRHRQGIRGPELVISPEVKRILYPIFLPEWLETTRTSRMVVNGVAVIADPAGTKRYSVSRIKTRIGFLPTGALLKISTPSRELELPPGQPFDVPLVISRAPELREPVRLELVRGEGLTAEPVVIDSTSNETALRIVPTGDGQGGEIRTVTIRATVLKDGEYPVVAETAVVVIRSAD